jgi:hypothetical protein
MQCLILLKLFSHKSLGPLLEWHVQSLFECPQKRTVLLLYISVIVLLEWSFHSEHEWIPSAHAKGLPV